MDKTRIFLGSSGKQEKLLQALTRGLEDIAHVVPWTTSFNPGTTTLERLVELSHEVDFAAFAFARDDWTTISPPATSSAGDGQASPRDNVVFEAGLFGGVLGMRRTFILHASGSKLPSDLLGLTSIRYGDATAAEVKVVNQKLRNAIDGEGHSWQEDGRLCARYWSEAVKERKEPSGIFYYWKGDRPLDPDAPQLDGTGEVRLESADRATGYFTTHADTRPEVSARTVGVYLRADPEDVRTLDEQDNERRAKLIADRLKHWKSIVSAEIGGTG